MDDVKIILTEALREDYRRLPESIQRKFDKQLRFLAQNPKHSGTHFFECVPLYVDRHHSLIR